MLQCSAFIAARRELLHVAVVGEPGKPIEIQTREAISRAVAEIERAGLPAGHIIRSRLWARDVETRAAASATRLEVLAGQRRAASSSFIDPQRLPTGSDMAIDLYALVTKAAPDSKTIREYDPTIAPPQFVTLDRLLVLSGDTDRSTGLEAQMASIRTKLDRTLAAGGGSCDQAISVSVFLARRLPAGAGRSAFASHFPDVRCPLMLTTVDGYSHPEKLVEIEMTADLA